jgi:hypothetical protein
MTTAVDAHLSRAEDKERIVSQPAPFERAPPTMDRRQSDRMSEATSADLPTPWRETTSSYFSNSVEQVYANILARPLEHVSTQSTLAPRTPVPAARDDVGWPLASKEEDWV